MVRNGAGALLAKRGYSSPAVVRDGARGLPGVGSGTQTCPCKDGRDSGGLLLEKGDTAPVMALGERALAHGGGRRKHRAHPRGDRWGLNPFWLKEQTLNPPQQVGRGPQYLAEEVGPTPTPAKKNETPGPPGRRTHLWGGPSWWTEGTPFPPQQGGTRLQTLLAKGREPNRSQHGGRDRVPCPLAPTPWRETRSSWWKKCTPVGRDRAPGFPARERGPHASLAKRNMAPRLPGRGKRPIAHHS